MFAKVAILAGLTVPICAGAMVAAQAAVVQPGATARSYRVGPFDTVASVGPNVVIVHLGGAPAVTAQGPAATLDKMEVVVEHGDLQIRPKRQFRDHFDWRGVEPATFTVTAPRLEGATLAGSGDMRVDRAEGDRFKATVAGSGDLAIGSLRVSRASLVMAGSGGLTARGSASQADVSVAGSGTVHASGVVSRTASVAIAGSGAAELTAQDTANVSIIGSGNATITGRAHCTVTRIGTGHLRCGN
jgi:hypothetical protein